MMDRIKNKRELLHFEIRYIPHLINEQVIGLLGSHID
jgi:hypothetical protein